MASAQLRLYHRRKEQGVCVTCGKLPPREGIARCETCAAGRCDISARQKARRPKGVCRSCLTRKAVLGRSTCKICREREREKGKKQYRQIRLDVLELYGGKCACVADGVACGDDNHKHLQLDHKNNDGAKERRSLPASVRGGRFYQLVLKQGKRDDLHLLCANCHNAKRYGGCTAEDHVRVTPNTRPVP